jgi:hypothetical protein
VSHNVYADWLTDSECLRCCLKDGSEIAIAIGGKDSWPIN